MKALVQLGVLFLLLGMVACGGEDLIFYINAPKTGFSGTNILHEDISELDTGTNYSMMISLDRDMAYKVILKNRSKTLPVNANDSVASVWLINNAFKNNGWFLLDYNYSNHSQTFFAEGPISAHLALDFQGCGKMDVEIYETGGNRLSESKEINWEGFCDP